MNGVHASVQAILCAQPPRDQWVPRKEQLLARLLTAVEGWRPLSMGPLLDDVAQAVDYVPPPPALQPELIQRLHAHLRQLENIALANGACHEKYVAGLVVWSRALRANPAGLGLGYLRQTGWACGELADALVALGCVKEPDDEREPG